MTRRYFASVLMSAVLAASVSAIGTPTADALVGVGTSHTLNVVGDSEYPFRQLVVEPNGRVAYLDAMFGQIDEATKSGFRVLLSSLRGSASSSSSIVGLSGLALEGSSLWFSAAGIVYKMTLSTHTVLRVGPAPGAIDLDVTEDGVIRYSTNMADYELSESGSDERIAGGGEVAWNEQATPHPATAEALNPVHLVATGNRSFDFVNENVLYRVVDGVATQIDRPGSFFNGELAHGPGNAVFGVCDWAICRIDGTKVTQLFSLVDHFTKAVPGDFIAPCGLAVGPTGTFYLSYSDQSSRGHAGVVELSKHGQVVRYVTTRTTPS